MKDNDSGEMSHFSICKMSQCRPTFFIVKHKTAHEYAEKKLDFGRHREQYSTVNRVIPLFSQTIFTISFSCSAVKVCVLSPQCGSLSVLQNTNTVSTLYSIDMQYYSTQGK